MGKNKLKRLLDFIPFVILSIYAILLLLKFSDFIFQWQHIVALIFLVITGILFRLKHQAGVLSLGLTILLAMIGQLQFQPGLSITKVWITDAKIPIFYGQPIFILWILLHFILSGRYYAGIVTKKYWQNIFRQ